MDIVIDKTKYIPFDCLCFPKQHTGFSHLDCVKAINGNIF